MLGDDVPGEKPSGVASLVRKDRATLNVRFPGEDHPSVLFVDRGQGFLATRGGKIIEPFSSHYIQWH